MIIILIMRADAFANENQSQQAVSVANSPRVSIKNCARVSVRNCARVGASDAADFLGSM